MQEITMEMLVDLSCMLNEYYQDEDLYFEVLYSPYGTSFETVKVELYTEDNQYLVFSKRIFKGDDVEYLVEDAFESIKTMVEGMKRNK